jgi:glycosyltransferase involved in cell wall biosynthesis
MNVSVCMATFNGERYVAEQIESILPELSGNDELVIVDDCSTDSTRDIIASFGDARIRCHRNERNRGIRFSFERAISLAKREFVVLCDQDDRWVPGRVGMLINTLEKTGAAVVSSNFAPVDGKGNALAMHVSRLREAASTRHVRNIARIFVGRCAYYGCTMALRRRIVDLVLPIPSFVESYDLWIALAANLTGSNAHLEADTVIRRVHGSNASLVPRSLPRKLWSRVILARSIAVIMARSRLRSTRL